MIQKHTAHAPTIVVTDLHTYVKLFVHVGKSYPISQSCGQADYKKTHHMWYDDSLSINAEFDELTSLQVF